MATAKWCEMGAQRLLSACLDVARCFAQKDRASGNRPPAKSGIIKRLKPYFEGLESPEQQIVSYLLRLARRFISMPETIPASSSQRERFFVWVKIRSTSP